MEIIIGKTAGFCFGVANAVNKTTDVLSKKNNVFCLGELVHNRQVTEELESKGLRIINDIELASDNLIIRAHGATKDEYKKAEIKKIDVIDLTCPKVLKIHNIVEKYSKEGYFIFLIGKKNHPEIIATISYCGDNSEIIENIDEIQNAIEKLNKSMLKKLLVITQTTFSLDYFNKIVDSIKQKTNKAIVLEIKNTICDATRLRQEETNEISSKVDGMIIIGGAHSSNTNKLYEIAKKNCKYTILIENEKEIDKNEIRKYNKIGIMAGASTPKKSIEAVIEMLDKL